MPDIKLLIHLCDYIDNIDFLLESFYKKYNHAMSEKDKTEFLEVYREKRKIMLESISHFSEENTLH